MPEKTNIELPRLDVVPESRCSQEVVDTWLRLLQDNCQDIICRMVEKEDREDRESRGFLVEVAEYLRSVEKDQPQPPLSRLEMIDLCFEFDRRVKTIFGTREPPVIKGHEVIFGVPPDGERLISLPTLGSRTNPKKKDSFYKKFYVEQELADRALNTVCERCPEILYEYAEAFRRHVPREESRHAFYNFLLGIREEIPTSGYIQLSALWREAGTRISVMCGLMKLPNRGKII
jgi:hypothetical protein